MLLLLTACSTDPSGVWLFHLAETPDGEDCGTTVSHNFIGAGLPTEEIDESEWEISESATWSESSLFGLVSATAEGFTLLLDGRIYEGDGETFTHVRTTDEDQRWTHPTGYQWSASETSTLELKATSTLEKGAWTGSWSAVDSQVEDYEESDGWSEDIGIGTTGQIPAATVLVEQDEAGDEVPVANLYEELDCADEPCQLSIATDCATEWGLSGELTDLSAEDFEAVAGYETDAGY